MTPLDKILGDIPTRLQIRFGKLDETELKLDELLRQLRRTSRGISMTPEQIAAFDSAKAEFLSLLPTYEGGRFYRYFQERFESSQKENYLASGHGLHSEY